MKHENYHDHNWILDILNRRKEPYEVIFIIYVKFLLTRLPLRTYMNICYLNSLENEIHSI